MPVWISSKASRAPSSSASAAAARNAGVERDDAAFAEHRLEQDQPDVVGLAALAATPTSFGGAKRAPARSGSNAVRFAGWPVTESAPAVRPWKLCSSAITPVLPVALRAYFSAASFASAPELQKNACCAAEALREHAPRAARAGSVP